MTTRRGFLSGLAALTLPARTWASVGNPAFLAAGRSETGYVLHGLGPDGDSLFQIDLPARGHAAAAHPHLPFAVAFARRPGTFALVLDCQTGRVLHHLTPPEGRQFNGHGVFSSDGSLLYTSEVLADTSDGRIGLWETGGYSRIAEWSSGGIGPHDIKRWPDGGLIIANGGIRTDPKDRTKLNIAEMRPNLTQLSPSGQIAAQVELPPELSQNSIRHLALGSGTQIAFAMQWEGDPAETVPLLGLWQPGSAPRLFSPKEADRHRMQGYAGSIAMSDSGLVALTSPKGGVVMIHAADGTHLATHSRSDVCGAAPLDHGFLISDGMGALSRCDTDGLRPLLRTGTAWDNHLVALG